jgi:sulfur-oxidizing protein SoxY
MVVDATREGRLMLDLRSFVLAGLVLAAPLPALADGDDPWPELQQLLFGARTVHDGAGVIALEAPERAHDAAVVPLTIEALLPQTAERYLKTVHLVIDRNPAPVAGVFHLTPASGTATIATRVRVNEYTDIHAIAETSDGELYMASRFVKAAGGCSAPALKDHEQAMARLGKMKLNHGAFQLGEPNQVQLLISHPNYSGLQIDQLSRNWIPPHYVQSIAVSYGDKPILAIDGDISLSENPSIHFSFVPDARGELAVEVRDSEGQTFTGSWPVAAGTSS